MTSGKSNFDPGPNGLCKGCSAVDERRCTCAATRRLWKDVKRAAYDAKVREMQGRDR